MEPSSAISMPMPTSTVGCSTECTVHRPVHDNIATPSGPKKRKGIINLGVDRKEKKSFVKIEKLIVRRSDRIKTARRVEKLGGMEYFLTKIRSFRKDQQHPPRPTASHDKGPLQPRMRNPHIQRTLENKAGSHESGEGE